uniref:Uncharacterized protein n=1 Tax=Arion vulgaris TaxID=1028688 RepID=A0A0B7BNQ6_9EUPU
MFWTILISVLVVYLLLDWIIRLFKVGNYSNKYVLITGCDSGFGRQLAIRLDKLGFPVFASCLTEAGSRSLSEVCSSRLVTLILNVADIDSIPKAYEFVKQKLPSDNCLWAVVNNAGISGAIASVEMLTQADYMSILGVNLLGPIEMSKVFLPLLRKSQGRLVLMSSMIGRCPATPAPYAVSKFGLEAFGDVVRRDVTSFGVKVSIIEPGYFKTSILQGEGLIKSVTESYDRSNPEVQAAYGKDYVKLAIAMVKAAIEFSSPDTHKVVDAYIAAITSVYPRPRYVVGFDAKLVYIPLSFLPEWCVDWFLASQRKKLTAKFK